MYNLAVTSDVIYVRRAKNALLNCVSLRFRTTLEQSYKSGKLHRLSCSRLCHSRCCYFTIFFAVVSI